ncbi:MAG: hypothetical protein K2H47_00795 [Muribaculaceae bacterium]|nr:hypothetical protein [Muribaculaceae bacterium]
MNLKYSLLCLAAAVASSSYAQVTLRYADEPDKGWGDASSVVTPYITFPTEFIAPYAGNEITSVRIAVMEEATNCYLYIKNKPNDQNNLYRQKLESLHPGWNEITLDTPFVIPSDESVAIGYKASFQAAGGVGISNEKFANADNVYYNSRNQWTTTGGSICITATVNGDRMPVNEMLISTLKENTDDASGLRTYSGYVRNVGNNPVNTYTITVRLDGEETESITGSALAVNEEVPFSFTINCDIPGNHTVTAEITEVNGVADSYAPNNITSATFTIQSEQFVHRMVCEEYTGTWCGWCPRGMVGLELMKEEYPNRFIPIAVHGGDPMEITDEAVSYKPFIDSCTGAPSSSINRQFTGDPFYDIHTMFNLASQLSVHIGVEATCDWNEDMTALELVTTYYSDIDLDNPTLNIAYTITESGITGYMQTNYYAGGRNGDFYGWQDKTDPTNDVTFNDVARAIIGGYNGMPCQSEAMTASTPYTHTYTIPLPQNVTSPDRIKVIPQIIDAVTGRIINAVEVTPDMSGINSVLSSPADVVIKAGKGTITVNADMDTPLQAMVYTPTGQLVASAQFSGNIHLNVPTGIYITVIKNSTNILKRTKLIVL